MTTVGKWFPTHLDLGQQETKWKKNREPGAELKFPGDGTADTCAKATGKFSGSPGDTHGAPHPAPWCLPQTLRVAEKSSHITAT